MGTPHKHAELIKAWADGEAIQSRPVGGQWEDAPSPGWYSNKEYRIKPEPKKVQLRFFEDIYGSVCCWTNSWSIDMKKVEKMSLFKRWVSPVEEREFDV